MILSWQIGADTTLPVELSSFTATASVDGVTLKWRAETEVGNVGFSVYRSETKDGNYTKLGFVSGAGNSAMSIDYQFTDKSAELGKPYYYYLKDIDIAGNKDSSDIIQVVVPAKSVVIIPKNTRLWQNFPNPFNPETWIPYNLSKDAEVLIRIYNVQGKLVRQLDLGVQKAGSYVDKRDAVYWDGKDKFGELVSSGLYFYSLKANTFQAVRRMVILK